MADTQRRYLPAAGRDWALPFYDPVVALMGGNPTRAALIDQAAVRPGHHVLEIGCGTGTLVVMLKRLHPDVTVTGLDPDPKALARARRKAQRAGVSIQLDQGFADAMPYVDASFDRVLSSFMFHHLPKKEKEPALREVQRVLKPGGELHLVDLAGPHGGGPSATRAIHSDQELQDNAEDRVLALMARAGLTDPRRVAQGALFFGRIHINYYKATAGGAAAG